MSATPPPEIIAATFGPFVTGIMLQQLFMGVIVIQVYDYYRVFTKDTPFYKCLVGGLFALSILQCSMDYKTLYRSAVEFYGNFDQFDNTDWTLWWEIGVTALIGSVCQAFFLQRCWQATQSWIVLGLGTAGILASLASGIASSIKFQMIGRLSRVPEIPAPILTWLISTAVLDIAIAGVLVVHMARIKTRFRKTETVIGRLIRVTFQTSALTAAVAVVNVVLYMALPGEAFHLLPQLVMGKIYVISTMVTLSSRADLRNIFEAPGGSSYQEGVTTRAGRNVNLQDGASQIQLQSRVGTINLKGGIQVSTTTYIQGDNDGKDADSTRKGGNRNVSGLEIQDVGSERSEIPIQYLGGPRGAKGDDESDSELDYQQDVKGVNRV